MDEQLQYLVAWAVVQPDIRAMLLTSTRATDAPVDRFSDYDVVLVCTDVAARRADEEWIGAFGDVVIAYWDDVYPDDDSGLPISGNVVYYPGTQKIDFTLWPLAQAAWLRTQPLLPTELDAGYRVLLDKDDLTSGWPPATGRGYRRSLPDADTYLKLVNDFFIGVPYVVTALLRGEILAAKWVLDFDMRYVYLLPMLEWYAVTLHGHQVRIGVHGKGLPKLMPSALWSRYANTYAGLDRAVNRTALDAMIDVFREAAEAVGAAIGCPYPQHLEARVRAHIEGLEA